MHQLALRGAFLTIVALGSMLCYGSMLAHAGEAIKRVAVIVSEPIRPYQEAVSSLERILKKNGVQVVILEMEEEGRRPSKTLITAVRSEKYKIWVSVGPQATQFLWSVKHREKVTRIYGMVLNPEELVDKGCGVPLNIPISKQVKIVRRLFREFKRIGILYDPKYNEDFVSKASKVAAREGIQIVPIEVSSKEQIRKILGIAWARIDAIWLIPDFTVISEPTVRFIIKEGLANNTAAIGYNRFFFHSGAVLSFVLNYSRIGEQIALLCLEAVAGRPCMSLPPFFEVWVNSRALELLGLKLSTDTVANLKVMP